jgi:hypothetical protein
VHQIVGSVDSGKVLRKRSRIENISQTNFGVFTEVVPQSFRMAGKTTNAMAGGFEDGQKASADVSGSTGEKN